MKQQLNFIKMKTALLISIGFAFYIQLAAQDRFYVNPSVGVVWNGYQNSNESITGNSNVSGIFEDNDWIFGLLTGYKFDNNLILESGFIYHNAVNRYSFQSESSFIGGSSVSLGEGFLCVPLNIKYNFKTTIDKFKIIPYLGVTYSTHKINSSPYMTSYKINYSDRSTSNTPMPQDTTAFIQAYRPTKNTFLMNYGIGFEYQLLDKLIISLSGNFTSGFSDINRVDVDVLLYDQTESGEIIYRGNKFFISCGIIIPFGFNKAP